MSFYECLASNPNKVLYDVDFKDVYVDTLNGNTPITVQAIAQNNLIKKGLTTVENSGISVTDLFNTKIIKTSTPTDPIKLQSDQGTVTIESGTSNVNIRADDVTGGITLQSSTQQMIAFNTISITANQQVIIQGSGGSQILIDTSGNVTISSGFGGGLSLLSNGGNSRWIFDPSSNSAGNLIFPSAPPVGECVLKINSIDNLMYWDPVIGP